MKKVTHNGPNTSRSQRLVAAALASFSLPLAAMDFKLDDGVEVSAKATVTAGTMIRTESPDPAIYSLSMSNRVGAPPGQMTSHTAGAGDLNFEKNKPVSTVIKAVADLQVKKQEFGAFARIMAWEDTELKGGNRAEGNFANGLARNASLSDAGFSPAAKFGNAIIGDAYVFGKAKVGESSVLDFRLGRQTLTWGTARLTPGGINVVNPVNVAAIQRPGALPEESPIPVGMVYANLAAGKNWGAEGFVQYEFRPTELPGCGTFFSTANYLAPGCNASAMQAFAPDLNEAAGLARGTYVHRRSSDDLASDGGQYGLSLRYAAEGLNTDFRAYALNYHSRAPQLRVYLPNVAGGYGTLAGALNSTRLTDPNGLQYSLTYAEDIKLYGLSFNTKINPTLSLYGEVAYRPNQPISLNASDLIAAFVTRAPTTALNVARGVNAIAPGGTFDGYDRFKVTTGTIGTTKVIPQVLGAERLVILGELAVSHVAGLPSLGVLRYGRADDFSRGALDGQVCTDTSGTGKQCAQDGYVSKNAWGLRLILSATYPGAVLGATVTPSLYLSKDVAGYSYDGTFLKDRQVVRPGVRFDWNKKYFANIQYSLVSGGAYNTFTDRDTLSLVVGASF